MPNWALYVDESGNFADPSQPVCVAAILIDENARGNSPAALRTALVKAVPGLPWPLHASVLNFSAYVGLAIWAALHRHHHHQQWWVAPAGEIVAAAEECYECLRGVAGCNDVIARLRQGREPSHKVLGDLTRKLTKQQPEISEALVRHGIHAWTAVGALLAHVAAAPAAAPAIWLVLSSETWRGDDAGDETGAARYNTLLQFLLTRTGDALTRLELPGVQSVNLKVLKRSGPAPFDRSHLTNILAAYRERWPRVKLRDGPVIGFYGDLAPGYVLADFAANRTREILDKVLPPIKTVEQNVVEALQAAVPVRSGERSHLAAGTPRRRKYRQWTLEQAREWDGGSE